jgi:hypothetical protein
MSPLGRLRRFHRGPANGGNAAQTGRLGRPEQTAGVGPCAATQLYHRGVVLSRSDRRLAAWHAGENLMAEPKSESTAAVMAVIEAEISAMQWVRRLPPRMGPNSGFGPACFYRATDAKGPASLRAGYGPTDRSVKKGTRFR